MKHFPTSLRLPADLKRWLQDYAAAHAMDTSRLMVWVLDQFRQHTEKTQKGEKK